MKMPIPQTATAYLSDEEPECSGRLPVMISNFPGEGRIARGPGDRMPWGATAGQWLADLLGGGIPAWLDRELEAKPMAKAFLSAIPINYGEPE